MTREAGARGPRPAARVAVGYDAARLEPQAVSARLQPDPGRAAGVRRRVGTLPGSGACAGRSMHGQVRRDGCVAAALAVCALLALPAAAETSVGSADEMRVGSADVPRASAPPPKIDGRLDDEMWSGPPTISDFH